MGERQGWSRSPGRGSHRQASSQGMTVVITMPEADEQADRIDDWWRANRDKAPNLFREKLERAVQLLAIAPEAGVRYRRRGIPGLRRLVLPETRQSRLLCPRR